MYLFVRLSKKNHARLVGIAKSRGVTLASLTAAIINAHLNRSPNKSPKQNNSND